jgi:hypothetical protein
MRLPVSLDIATLCDWESAMSLSRHALLATCLVLSGALAPGGAQAQQGAQDKPFDAKPFIPPFIPLPPNAQVGSGTITQTPFLGDPGPVNNPQTPPPASGLRLTVPMR